MLRLLKLICEYINVIKGDNFKNNLCQHDRRMGQKIRFVSIKMGCLSSKAEKVDAKIFRPLLKFETDCLEEHNKLRALHGCPPLKSNEALRALAQDWAQHLAETNVMKHRPGNQYGENIFWAQNMAVDGRFPVTSWYSEIKDYDYGKPDFSPKTGHFTQVVWKGTQLMGTGVVVKDGTVWVVVNYDPPGNIKGKFEKNVPPPIKETYKIEASINEAH